MGDWCPACDAEVAKRDATIARLSAELEEARAERDALVGAADDNALTVAYLCGKRDAAAALDRAKTDARAEAVNVVLSIIKAAQWDSGAIDMCGNEVDEEIVQPIRAILAATAQEAGK